MELYQNNATKEFRTKLKLRSTDSVDSIIDSSKIFSNKVEFSESVKVLEDLFLDPENIKTISELSKLDKNTKDYADFLEKTKTSSEKNQQIAINALIKILRTNSKKTLQPTIDKIIAALKNETPERKQLIISKMKQVLAHDKTLDRPNFAFKNLENVMKSHGDKYNKYMPTNMSSLRDTLMKELSQADTYKPEIDAELIGFSAYYRKDIAKSQYDVA